MWIGQIHSKSWDKIIGENFKLFDMNQMETNWNVFKLQFKQRKLCKQRCMTTQLKFVFDIN